MIFSSARFTSAWVTGILSLALFGAGCLPGTSSTSATDGGIFRTKDEGGAWQQLRTLNLGTKLGSIANLGTAALTVDPQDPLAVYAGTLENGLLYSLDGGESWNQARGLSIGRVQTVAVDPKDKCTVYATRGNQIFKTDNCGRDWNQAYFDPRTALVFQALIVDWYNPRTLYAGTSEGDIFRSDDGGKSWRRLQLVARERVNSLAIDPRDSRVIYAATNGSGILKTTDGGASWTAIADAFKDFEGAKRVTAVVVDPQLAGTVYAVSKYGILESNDAGATWHALTLPTPAGTVDIRALAVHPKDSRVLVYATNASLVVTRDSGATWTARKLPTTRGVSSIVFDRSPREQTLFLGTAPIKK